MPSNGKSRITSVACEIRILPYQRSFFLAFRAASWLVVSTCSIRRSSERFAKSTAVVEYRGYYGPLVVYL